MVGWVFLISINIIKTIPPQTFPRVVPSLDNTSVRHFPSDSKLQQVRKTITQPFKAFSWHQGVQVLYPLSADCCLPATPSSFSSSFPVLPLDSELRPVFLHFLNAVDTAFYSTPPFLELFTNPDPSSVAVDCSAMVSPSIATLPIWFLVILFLLFQVGYYTILYYNI